MDALRFSEKPKQIFTTGVNAKNNHYKFLVTLTFGSA
jgi:hypothetical protein